jgi:3-hydroxyacyl-[acyl-carrier-protein] dehydratase
MLEDELYTIIEKADNVVRIRLRAESEIFKGHFPGNPITPGVCQVGIIGELAEKLCSCKLTLREVKTLKYTDILRPSAKDVEVKFDKLDETGGELAAKGTVVSDGQVYTKFSLIFAKEA